MLDKDDEDHLDALSIFSGTSETDRKRRYDFHFSLPSPQQLPQPMDVDTSGGPIRLSPAITSPRPSEKKQKLNSGRARLKIRKLANCEDDTSGSGSDPKRSGGMLRLRMVVCFSTVVLVAVLVALASREDLREEFYKRYMKQYQALLHDVDDYCSQEFDFSATAKALSSGLVGQSEAVEKIVEIVNRRQHERFTSMALLGSTGVGKSLMANIIAKKFQWQSNVHHFFWDFTSTAEKRFERFQSFLYGIRHGRDVDLKCGRSLIIVDHLGSGDVEMINKIDVRLRFVADKDDVQLMVLYVFQGALMKDGSDVVQHLNRNIEQVFLRSLNEEDLMKCINLETSDLGIKLDEHSGLREELIASMDVGRYGCKAVRAKLAYYSKMFENGS